MNKNEGHGGIHLFDVKQRIKEGKNKVKYFHEMFPTLHYGIMPKEEVKMNTDLIIELSILQTTFTGELIKLAKKYNMDANDLMKQAIFSFNATAKETDFNK